VVLCIGAWGIVTAIVWLCLVAGAAVDQIQTELSGSSQRLDSRDLVAEVDELSTDAGVVDICVVEDVTKLD
jgi:hypothetical protein